MSASACVSACISACVSASACVDACVSRGYLVGIWDIGDIVCEYV